LRAVLVGFLVYALFLSRTYDPILLGLCLAIAAGRAFSDTGLGRPGADHRERHILALRSTEARKRDPQVIHSLPREMVREGFANDRLRLWHHLEGASQPPGAAESGHVDGIGDGLEARCEYLRRPQQSECAPLSD
jgi:hypothetical protein